MKAKILVVLMCVDGKRTGEWLATGGSIFGDGNDKVRRALAAENGDEVVDLFVDLPDPQVATDGDGA